MADGGLLCRAGTAPTALAVNLDLESTSVDNVDGKQLPNADFSRGSRHRLLHVVCMCPTRPAAARC